MRTAISIWNERISPVFDTSRRLLVLDIEGGEILARREEEFVDLDPFSKVTKLREMKVQVLVCGAISRPLHEAVTAQGLRVIAFVKGDLGEVIQAWIKGGLEKEAFQMPGCCGRGRRRRLMAGAGRVRAGAGSERNGRRGGMGRDGGAGGRGRNCGYGDGALGVGPSGYCVCPQCGYREAHQPGAPCVGRQCPRCGTALTRE